MVESKHNGARWLPLIAVLGSGLGAGGGLYVGSTMTPAQIQEIARPDPFTGTQGQVLERRIIDLERRMSNIENQIRDEHLHELEDRLERLEDSP